jgi:TRAP-type C4-dicarboxylate transport system substrate-binding protein
VTGKAKGSNWYRVETEQGASGFVYGNLETPPEGAEPAPKQPAAPRVAVTTWELLTPFASDSFETRNLEQFVSELGDATNGGFKLVVLSTPSMRGADIEQAVAAGRAPAGEFLISDLGGRNPAFEADLVPFLATTYDEALALWDASRPVLQPLLEADGLHLAFVVAHPPRGMFVDKELWKMSDLRGVRILDDHPMTAKFAALVSAVAAERPQGTLAQAFTTNKIDAMIASIPAGVAENAWTFVQNYYDLRISLPKSVVVFNRAAYAALDPEIQRAVLNAAVAAQNRGWATSATANNDGIDLLRSKGMTVAAPPREIADGLKQVGASMARDWAQRAGDQGQTILGQYHPAQVRAAQ